MNELCGWSRERLTGRHARYAKVFEKPRHGNGSNHARKGRTAVPLARTRTRSSPPPPLPGTPQPSADKNIYEVAALAVEAREKNVQTDGTDGVQDVNVTEMLPVQALNLLCAYVQHLLADNRKNPPKAAPKPPTPPSSNSSSSASSQANTPVQTPGPTKENSKTSSPPAVSITSPSHSSPAHPFLQRVPRAARTPIDSPVSNPQSPLPPSHPTSPQPYDKETHFIAQSDKLARKFYSKSVPPVSLPEYLGRLHKWCPCSVGVYLAAGIYIERLVRRDQSRGRARRHSMLPLTPVSSNSDGRNHWPSTAPPVVVLEEDEEEDGAAVKDEDEDMPLVQVEPKSVHRLLLAALRVAQKALDDAVFAHKRVADVGGVSQLELARLEVSMCFLTDFELVIKLRDMESWVRRMRAAGLYTEKSKQVA